MIDPAGQGLKSVIICEVLIHTLVHWFIEIGLKDSRLEIVDFHYFWQTSKIFKGMDVTEDKGFYSLVIHLFVIIKPAVA